jgi:ATP-dependent Clp protease ATP-binding subunit ClpA/protein subunit release factor B
MRQKFRLFVQKHDIGTYTVTVPGIERVSVANEWDDESPAAPSLASYGLMLEEVKDDVREALAKWLSKVDPAQLSRYNNYKDGQYLEKAEVELRLSDRHGRKRHDKVKIKFSLLVTKDDSEQYLITVPKLTSPPLAFYCYQLDELKEFATRELAAYFGKHSLEDLLEYQHQRQEFLDEIEVSFTPVKPQKEKKKKEEQEDHGFWALKAAGVSLTARAKEGKLMRAYRRDREVNDVLNVLAAERNNCILLVGPSGVGKTAIVHEVVRRVVEDNCPPALRKRQLWYTNANQLIAGCSYIGQWEEKLKNVIDEVKKKRHVLHVDDIVSLMGAGRWSKGDENMAQFLKPFIADGTMVLIGETTPERLSVGENKDPGFLRLFRTLSVEETNEDATLSILGSVAAGLERTFKARVQPSAIEATVELTRRFQPYRAFPGKAVSFLEQVAADAGKTASDERPLLTRQYIVSAFARHTGLPEFILSDHLTLDPGDIERYFSERLIGQPDALQTVVNLITVIKAGLNDPQKPLGCFFFVGPTGVGKTEMAKTLAEYLFGHRDRLIRFDMSEYAEPLNVAKLIGSPLGDAEGELTRRIRLQPFSVVLLDEFEKAHPSIFDVMLQVLGEGRLTDAGGRTADFRSAIIIMTSNLGASPREQRKPGLLVDDPARSLESHFREQVERFFRPEFVNRIDKVVVFRALEREAMQQIAARELNKLLQREGITRRHLLVEIDDEVMDVLLETGFSRDYGARPLKRAIEQRIIAPLARYLVAHRITGSQLIQIRREADQVRLVSTPLTEAKQQVKRAPAPLLLSSPSDRKMDLKELVEGFAAVRLRLHEWAESDTVREIKNEWKKLLARTRRRDFVPYGEEAHTVWSRIVHFERLVKRLDKLKERAEYLEEFTTLTQRERDGRYQPDLVESYVQLCRDVDYVEIELLCAHLKESSQALLRLKSLGRRSALGGVGAEERQAWMLRLAKMYLRWAKRKGYEFDVFVPTESYKQWIEAQGFAVKGYIPTFEPGPPPKPPWAEVRLDDMAALLKRLEEMSLSELAVSVKGPNVYGFLKGEAGTHKLLFRNDETEATAPFQTAVVEVEALGEEVPAQEYLNAMWEKAQEQPVKDRKQKAEEVPKIIRVYVPDGDRHVRDLRTGVRTVQVNEVFDGELDEFILAYLKSEEAATAWG